MAAYEMYDDLSNVTADYTSTLVIKTQKVIIEMGRKNQSIREADDNSEERVSFSDAPIWFVRLQMPSGAIADVGTILEWWGDSAKANGMARTFYWTHPTDGHDYTVRFSKDPTRSIPIGFQDALHGLEIELRVLGRKP